MGGLGCGHGSWGTPTLDIVLKVKMRQRQEEAFARMDCEAQCTVGGMLEAHSMGSNGEITPTHICDTTQKVGTDFAAITPCSKGIFC